MRIKVHIFLTISLLYLSFALAFGNSYAESKIIVAGDANFPPVEYLENNNPKGLNVQLWQELSKAMGRGIEIKLMLWKDAQKKVLEGEVDALTLLGPTEQRKKLYDFSEPWLEFEFVFFIRSDDLTIKNINDLEGRIVGVTEGGYPREVLESNKNIKLWFIKNNLEGFRLLQSNKISAVATDKWVGAYTIQKYDIDDIRMVEKPFAKTVACIPVKKGNTKLLDEINLGIMKLRKDGAIKEILDKWSPKRVVFLTRERINRIIIIAVTALLIAVIASTLLWIVMLRRQVKDRTKELLKANEQLKGETEELRRAEEEIRKFKTISDRAGHGSEISDIEGNLIYTNEAFARMHGYAADELLGKNLSIFHNEEQMKNVNRLKERLRQEGSYVAEEVWHIRKDNTVFPTLMNGTLIRDEQGNPLFMAATAIDITERRRADEELRNSREQLRNLSAHLQSVREQERTLIAGEIHDDLGQSLTALKMDISWLGKKLPKDQETLLEKTKAMSELTGKTIKRVQRICTELRPSLLDHLGLVETIEWQAEEFQNRTGIHCKLSVDPEDMTLDEKRSTALFRILQETLTNVTRHAQATRVTVSLKETDGTLELKVRDNGKGITKEQISDSKSFGLMGIRERVHPWGREVKVSGMKGKGTTVVVRVPVGEEGEPDDRDIHS